MVSKGRKHLYGTLGVCSAVLTLMGIIATTGQDEIDARRERTTEVTSLVQEYKSSYAPNVESKIQPLRIDFAIKCMNHEKVNLSKYTNQREEIASEHNQAGYERWFCNKVDPHGYKRNFKFHDCKKKPDTLFCTRH